MLKLRLLPVLLLFLPLLSRGQEWCGADAYHQQRMRSDPAYAAAVKQQREAWARFGAMARIVVTGSDTVYEIPTVVHVLHFGEPLGTGYNYSDAFIMQTMDSINLALSGAYPGLLDTASGGAYIPVRFVLAKTGPNCTPTNGIQRVNASSFTHYVNNGWTLFNNGPGIDTLNWPDEEYFNLYLVSFIDNNTAAGLGGPGGSAIIASGYFSSSLGGIITPLHEIGHCLSLDHVFEGDNLGTSCPPNGNCTFTGDGVCDTEPTIRWPDCATPAVNPCTNLPFDGIRHNIMHYTTCTRTHFTPGQRDKMVFFLRNRLFIHSRKSLALSSPLAPAACRVYCAYDSRKSGGPMLFDFAGIHNPSSSYPFDPMPYRDYSCTMHAEITAGQTYAVTVETDMSGLHAAKVYIDFNNDGSFLQAGELVFSSINPPVHSGSITIHFTAVPDKPLRMRVVTDTFTNAFFGPCGQLLSGQAEDYAVTIRGATGPAGTPETAALPRVPVHPNPVADKLYIEHTGACTGAEVVSADGRLVKRLVLTGDRTVCDLSALPRGAYFLKLTGPSGSAVTRFIK